MSRLSVARTRQRPARPATTSSASTTTNHRRHTGADLPLRRVRPADRRAGPPSGGSTTNRWQYCYDNAGNRTYTTGVLTTATCPVPGATPTTATYTYDNTNALVMRAGKTPADFAYDGVGNELAAAGGQVRTGGAYNNSDQLTGVTTTTTATGGAPTGHTFGYSGTDNTERTVADGTRYQNTPLGVTTAGGTSPARFIREPGGQVLAMRSGGLSYYPLADVQGSTISLVTGSGVEVNHYAYDPYGADRGKTETISNPLQYTGSQLDSTGLYHLGARYYDPSIGRFTQTDPTGQDPHYTYAGNNPINNSDRTGSSSIEAFLAFTGVALAVVGVVGLTVTLSPLVIGAAAALTVLTAAIGLACYLNDEDVEVC